jgi:hypothetical protein
MSSPLSHITAASNAPLTKEQLLSIDPTTLKSRAEYDQWLWSAMAQFIYDPYGFVLFAYPWGQKGTFLENETGPDDWQTRELIKIGELLKKNAELPPEERTAVRIAIATGHGVGKTAFIAWLNQWFMSTRPNPQIVVTANTKTQLETKTWRELAKWHQVSVNAHWFKRTATRFSLRGTDTWFAAAIPWVKERSEAFAGTHEEYVLYLFDEASLIADEIWEVAEGAMTTPGAVWITCGNPTRAEGRFRECFKGGKFAARWHTSHVDARTAKKANKTLISQWAEDYGEDSDFFKVRAMGVFPRSSVTQFISSELVIEASKRALPMHVYNREARIMAIDVAREGDDRSCFAKRQGLVAFPPIYHRVDDTMVLVRLAIQEIKSWQPDAVFVDIVGVGAGVYDRLRELKYRVIPVNGKYTAADGDRYANLRAEMWWKMRDWLIHGGVLPDDQQLRDDLTAPEYGYDGKDRVQLEKKKDIKARVKFSPDGGDALAMTFAVPVPAKGSHEGMPEAGSNKPYNVLTWGSVPALMGGGRRRHRSMYWGRSDEYDYKQAA